jgi:dimethylargininase
MEIALTRDVSPAIQQAELTYLERQPIDLARAVAQHDAYCEALSRLGLRVLRLPADTACPDCCFVEDTAVVVDELAVMAAPTPVSRRPEVPAVASALAAFRELAYLPPDAHLEGGDVLQLGRVLYVGFSSRTNQAGIVALAHAVEPFPGYRVARCPCPAACTSVGGDGVGDEAVIANPDWIDMDVFADVAVLPVHAQEPFAANVLRARRAHRGRGPSAHAGPARPLRLRGAAARHVGVREGGGGRHLQEHRVPRSEGLGRQRRERRRPATSTPTSTSAFVMTELDSRRGESIESDGLLEPPWAALSPPFATNFQPRPRGRGRGRAHGRARP